MARETKAEKAKREAERAAQAARAADNDAKVARETKRASLRALRVKHGPLDLGGWRSTDRDALARLIVDRATDGRDAHEAALDVVDLIESLLDPIPDAETICNHTTGGVGARLRAAFGVVDPVDVEFTVTTPERATVDDGRDPIEDDATGDPCRLADDDCAGLAYGDELPVSVYGDLTLTCSFLPVTVTLERKATDEGAAWGS